MIPIDFQVTCSKVKPLFRTQCFVSSISFYPFTWSIWNLVQGLHPCLVHIHASSNFEFCSKGACMFLKHFMFIHCFSGTTFYRNNNKRLSDSEYELHQCVYFREIYHVYVGSTCTNIVNGSYIRERYNENSLSGSEIRNFSFSLRFYLVLHSIESVFSWYKLHYD